MPFLSEEQNSTTTTTLNFPEKEQGPEQPLMMLKQTNFPQPHLLRMTKPKRYHLILWGSQFPLMLHALFGFLDNVEKSFFLVMFQILQCDSSCVLYLAGPFVSNVVV